MGQDGTLNQSIKIGTIKQLILFLIYLIAIEDHVTFSSFFLGGIIKKKFHQNIKKIGNKFFRVFWTRVPKDFWWKFFLIFFFGYPKKIFFRNSNVLKFFRNLWFFSFFGVIFFSKYFFTNLAEIVYSGITHNPWKC